eukprot:scaffold2111_cov363-Pavlova_lutheri.AAC.2
MPETKVALGDDHVATLPLMHLAIHHVKCKPALDIRMLGTLRRAFGSNPLPDGMRRVLQFMDLPFAHSRQAISACVFLLAMVILVRFRPTIDTDPGSFVHPFGRCPDFQVESSLALAPLDPTCAWWRGGRGFAIR